MNIRPEYLNALRSLGYTDTEAVFLYIVATHSGYFTQRQYLLFTGHRPGSFLYRLTSRIIKRRHARATAYTNNTHVYNLYSRRIYDAIDKHNLRNRRRQSIEMIHTRLMILDFVLGHRDEKYLETEADKVDYFTRQFGIPITALPGRRYYGINSAANTKRYFLDRFPIILPASGNPLGLAPVVTFTYCDTPGTSLFAYLTHLQRYEKFLRRLPDFNFIFASAEPSKFDRARAFFAKTFAGDRQNIGRLLHYFKLRKLWETQHTAALTRADRDFLRDATIRFEAPDYQVAYEKWAAGTLSEDQIQALVPASKSQPKGSFHTYLQPEANAIFSTESARDYRNRSRDRVPDRFSPSPRPACEG